ncbi:MAG: GFA family protein [Candidatus Ozemobacteraceae bacterium]
MEKHKASCSCGQLALVYDGEIERISICHCYACQKRTGSVFGVQTRLDKNKIRISGQATKYDRPTDEGDHVHFYFCPTCGATVYGEIDDLPETVSVAIGTSDNRNLPNPVFSVYEEQMVAWVVLPESVTEHMD